MEIQCFQVPTFARGDIPSDWENEQRSEGSNRRDKFRLQKKSLRNEEGQRRIGISNEKGWNNFTLLNKVKIT